MDYELNADYREVCKRLDFAAFSRAYLEPAAKEVMRLCDENS